MLLFDVHFEHLIVDKLTLIAGIIIDKAVYSFYVYRHIDLQI